MARTKINTEAVVNASSKANSARNATANVSMTVSSIRWRTDSRILGRNGISSSFTNVQNSISQIATDIEKICRFANSAASEYQNTENRILSDGRTMGLIVTKADTSMPTSSNKSTYEALFVGAAGEDSERAKNGWDCVKNFFDFGDETNDFITTWLPESKVKMAFELLGNGIKFTTKKDASGKFNLVLDNFQGLTRMEMKDKLQEFFSMSIKTKYDVKVFERDGITLFKDGVETNDYRKLENMLNDDLNKMLEFDEALKYIKNNVGFTDTLKNTGGKFVDEFVNGAKDMFDYSQFNSLSKLDKAGKIAGNVGDVLTVVTNIFDNNYDGDMGTWNFTVESVTNTVTDVAIDIGSGLATQAAGAAIGSLIVPPVGTVVGFAAGIAIDAAINYDIADWDGDGDSDSLVDGAKYLVDSAVDHVFGWFGM